MPKFIIHGKIDYSLKTAVIFGELNEQEKNYLLENLSTENNDWIFKNFETDFGI